MECLEDQPEKDRSKTFHQCDTGCLYKATPQKKKKSFRSPLLNRVLGGFWQEETQAIALSQHSPVSQEHVLSHSYSRSICWGKCTVCISEAIAFCAGSLLAVSTQLQQSCWALQLLNVPRCLQSREVGHQPPSIQPLGKQQQPEGLGGRGQIATANEVTWYLL